MNQANIALSLKSTTLGTSDDVQCMVVRASDCEVSILWAENDRVEVNVTGDAAALPNIYCGAQLAGLVLTFLYSLMTADHAFLCDVFMNAEGNDFRELSMPVHLPSFAGA
jgi:hypothetical protein